MPRQKFYVAPGATRPELLTVITRFLQQLPPEKPFRVEIVEHKPRRSDSQNAYLWGGVYRSILEQGAEQLGGWEAADLHEYCLGEWGGWETIAHLGRKRQRPLLRSSHLTKQEFADFLEFIIMRMAKLGITVPAAAVYPQL